MVLSQMFLAVHVHHGSVSHHMLTTSKNFGHSPSAAHTGRCYCVISSLHVNLTQKTQNANACMRSHRKVSGRAITSLLSPSGILDKSLWCCVATAGPVQILLSFQLNLQVCGLLSSVCASCTSCMRAQAWLLLSNTQAAVASL